MDNEQSHPIIKGASAWALVFLGKMGVHTWSDAAAVLATFYSLLLIGEWFYKRRKGPQS